MPDIQSYTMLSNILIFHIVDFFPFSVFAETTIARCLIPYSPTLFAI